MLSDRCPVLSACLSVTVYCGQMVGRIKMKLGMQVGLDPGHIVLSGDPAPPPLKGHSPPIFGPYLLRPNGAWIKMSLGMEVGLGPGDFVLDGDPVPFPSAIFGPFLLWPNSCMHQNATWYGARPWPRRLC